MSPIAKAGSFAAIINLSGCIDTTACQVVSPNGIKNIDNQKVFEVYPNPSNGTFTLNTNQLGIYKIVGDLGQVVQIINITNIEATTVHLNDVKPGLYYLIGGNNAYKQALSVVK